MLFRSDLMGGQVDGGGGVHTTDGWDLTRVNQNTYLYHEGRALFLYSSQTLFDENSDEDNGDEEEWTARTCRYLLRSLSRNAPGARVDAVPEATVETALATATGTQGAVAEGAIVATEAGPTATATGTRGAGVEGGGAVATEAGPTVTATGTQVTGVEGNLVAMEATAVVTQGVGAEGGEAVATEACQTATTTGTQVTGPEGALVPIEGVLKVGNLHQS